MMFEDGMWSMKEWWMKFKVHCGVGVGQKMSSSLASILEIGLQSLKIGCNVSRNIKERFDRSAYKKKIENQFRVQMREKEPKQKRN